MLGRLSVAALLLLVASGILYGVFLLVGLNEATRYRGDGSPSTESWLRVAELGMSGSAGALLFLWLLVKANECGADTAAIGGNEG